MLLLSGELLRGQPTNGALFVSHSSGLQIKGRLEGLPQERRGRKLG